ncbi:hypothetical protein MACH09_45370 [Vibrio sp. MACH09]|uniref:hypothetical protein n=1 Tax=Vibrio sp. MACH09 TaxID=3025122 RepID=UPI00278FF7A3|nr:hypothetical protein [Vibrio sp. MACH09]GLO64029.1 hypothetical protein MACH09_45370 [Vibrio sp. MACH09]
MKIRKLLVCRSKKSGFTLYDFMLWLVAAAITLVGVIALYNTASAWSKESQTVQAVTALKAGAEKVKVGNHASTTLAKVCDVRRNAVSMNICGTSRNGVAMNPYGGNYTLTPNSANLSQVIIGVTRVDTKYIDNLADALAKLSVGNCIEASGCTAITVSGSTITVIM